MGPPKFLDVGGVRTRYFEAGWGTPLLLIHGGQFGDYYSSFSWSLNFQKLSQHFHVAAFDKLGMGHTDNPRRETDYTMQATIEHAHSFVSALGFKGCAVAGHSRGALVAAKLAIDHPNLFNWLVVIDSNTLGPEDPSRPKHFYDEIEKRAPKVPTRDSVQDEAKANSYSRGHITPDFVDELYEIARLPKTVTARGWMKKHNRAFFKTVDEVKKETLDMIRSGRLKQRTLVVWGSHDPSAPVPIAFRLFRLMSEAEVEVELHVFSRSGHCSFREHPDEFSRLVSNFVDR